MRNAPAETITTGDPLEVRDNWESDPAQLAVPGAMPRPTDEDVAVDTLKMCCDQVDSGQHDVETMRQYVLYRGNEIGEGLASADTPSESHSATLDRAVKMFGPEIQEGFRMSSRFFAREKAVASQAEATQGEQGAAREASYKRPQWRDKFRQQLTGDA